MAIAPLNPNSLANPLHYCGYHRDLLINDFPLNSGRVVPLLGFAQAPVDSRSACVAVLSADVAPQVAVESCKELGTPIVFVCFQGNLQWWKQGARTAEYIETVPGSSVEQFFSLHRLTFSPQAIYRAKTWGRVKREYQLSFVDLGLMPVVEEEVGRALGALIERNVDQLRSDLAWKQVTDAQGHWLLEAIFWIVSAKILRDKQVGAFRNINLTDVRSVFEKVGRHYGTPALSLGSPQQLEALGSCARTVGAIQQPSPYHDGVSRLCLREHSHFKKNEVITRNSQHPPISS